MVRLPSRRSGIRARLCQACLTHTAITPPAGQSVRSKATLRGDTGSVGDVAPPSETGPIAEPSRACPCRRPPARNTRRTLASQQQDTGESHSSVPPSQSIRSRHTPDPSRCTRYVAKHPLRSDTPDQKGCNAYGSGAPPPTTSPTAGNSPPQTPTVRPGRSHTASTYSPRLRTRGAAPVRERYTPSELV